MRDHNLITAPGTGYLEFTKEIMKYLDVYTEAKREQWYALYKNNVKPPIEFWNSLAHMLRKITFNLLFFFLFLTSILSTSASASVFIEPFIGYGFGSNIKINDYSYTGETITDNGSYSGGAGIGYGAKAGYQMLGLFGGINYLHRNFNFGNESFSSSKDSVIDELGLMVGYQVPILFKAYVGLNIVATGTMQHRSGKLEMKDGGGTFFGFGYTGLPFVHVNFEYHKGYFDEQTNGGLVSGKETNYDYLFLAVSLPYHFL